MDGSGDGCERSGAARSFRDYRWVKDDGVPAGRPEGVEPVDPQHAADGFFTFISLGRDCRVEQYDASGRFVRVVHDPADNVRDLRRIDVEQDGRVTEALRVDDCGAVRMREVYTYLDAPGGRFPLVKAEIYNADGRLLEVHTSRQVGPTAQDIHVTDGLGKLKVILHHADMDRGEPYTITSQWPD